VAKVVTAGKPAGSGSAARRSIVSNAKVLVAAAGVATMAAAPAAMAAGFGGGGGGGGGSSLVPPGGTQRLSSGEPGIQIIYAAVPAKPASGTEVAPDVANATVFGPFSSAAPVLSGSAIVGRRLASSPGVWSGSPESFSYQWQRCSVAGGGCVSIPGATEAGYSVTRGDLGRRLRALVTASNGARSASAASGISRIVGGVVESTITWEFRYTRRYTRVAKLLLRRLPAGSSIEVRCIGDGCPFTRVRCSTAGCRPRESARHASELSLASLFAGRRLAPGAEITVTITVPNWIARQFAFTAHAGTAPSLRPQCLPPGSTTPRTHC
jgi:hypothetical protein